MKIFILEDDPRRMKLFYKKIGVENTIFHSDNVEEAKKIFNDHKPFDYIFLDHDLGGEIYVPSGHSNTGYQFAKLLAEQDDLSGNICIHTMNPIGAENMAEVLSTYSCVTIVPFNFLIENLLLKEN